MHGEMCYTSSLWMIRQANPAFFILNVGPVRSQWLAKISLVWHIARMHGCVRNDSAMHKTVLLDCMTCAVAKLLRLWQHTSALWHHVDWIRIVTSHNAWMGYEYSLPNVNHPRAIHNIIHTPSKQWGVCDKVAYCKSCLKSFKYNLGLAKFQA